MGSPSRPGAHHQGILAGALLGLAMVLWLKRYAGINHDAVLYLGQGLAHRWPSIYGQDLVFVHGGGQERYTLLPWLLDYAFGWASPPTVFLWGAIGALLLFAAASWSCMRALLPAGQRLWAWLGVLSLPPTYGMVSMFGYSEQFFTPRPLAEALCLFAIALVARGRWLAAAIAFALAGLLHPLQTIAALLVVWPWAAMHDRRWLHAAWLAIPAALLAAAKVGAFAGLARQLDPVWLLDLQDSTWQLFVTRWSGQDFNALGFDALVLAYAWRALRNPFGTWCAASLAGLALGMMANLVLVDWLHLELPTGLQLWRVHWLAHWMSMAALATLLLRDLRAPDVSRCLLLALAFALTRSDSPTWLAPALLYAAWPLLFARREAARQKTLLGWLFAAGLAILFASYASSEYLMFRIALFRYDLYAFDRRLLAFPFVALGLAGLGMLAWARLGRGARWWAVACVLCPLVALGALRWDARAPLNLAIEDAAFRADLFGEPLPEHAQVYWAQHLLTGPWLALQRVSYFSPHQISGQVFNRAIAIDGSQRLARMRPLIEEDLGCQDRTMPEQQRSLCHVSDDAMRRACTPAGNLRPDYLVLPYRQPQRSLGTWTVMDEVVGEPAMTFWLYACNQVMEDLDTRPASRGG